MPSTAVNRLKGKNKGHKGYALQAGNGLDESIHPGCAGLLHLIGDMAVHVQGKSSGSVAQVALRGFDVVAAFYRCHGVRVPKLV